MPDQSHAFMQKVRIVQRKKKTHMNTHTSGTDQHTTASCNEIKFFYLHTVSVGERIVRLLFTSASEHLALFCSTHPNEANRFNFHLKDIALSVLHFLSGLSASVLLR